MKHSKELQRKEDRQLGLEQETQSASFPGICLPDEDCNQVGRPGHDRNQGRGPGCVHHQGGNLVQPGPRPWLRSSSGQQL